MKEKIFTAILSYLGAFMLGAYTTAQFKFDTPVEGHRWIITSFFFLFFVGLTFKNKKE